MIHLAKVFFLNADFYVVTWYRWELVHTFLTSDKDDLFQVSYLGTVHLEVIAKRLSLPDNLVRGGTFPFYLCMGGGRLVLIYPPQVGLAALAVAKRLHSKVEVKTLCI